ncbi:MAG: hypothetical protein PHN69_06240 [Candidatus Pacebacteria bacterium]|nr:hypothetical protein [Candidatus Paceibacterota bacterium]
MKHMRLNKETRENLKALETKPNETYSDVLKRLLNEYEEQKI